MKTRIGRCLFEKEAVRKDDGVSLSITIPNILHGQLGMTKAQNEYKECSHYFQSTLTATIEF